MATAKIEWQAEHKRGDQNPKIWRLEVTELFETTSRTVEICVHRWFNLPGWYMDCAAAKYDDYQLIATDIEEAKREAVEKVAARLVRTARIYQRIARKLIRAKISP